MKKFLYAIAIVLLTIGIGSCNKAEIAESKAVLTSASQLTFEAVDADVQLIDVIADGKWHVENVPSWMTVTPSEGFGYTEDVEIAVTDNIRDGAIDNNRKATIVFKGSILMSEAPVQVFQDGDKYRDIPNSTISDVEKMEDEAVVIVPEATVAAVTADGHILTDGKAFIHVVDNVTAPVGSVVSLMGDKTSEAGYAAIINPDKMKVVSTGEYTFPALLDGKIIYDDDKKELTFDNIVLDEGYQIIIRDGAELTINLVGENHVRLNYPEDITIYKMGHVRIKGGGSLKAQEIYFVKSDSLTIEDGCDIELQNLAGHGIVTIDNSTVTLLGDSIGTVYGFYEFNLKNCTVETPSSIFYNSINEVFEDYTSQWGYLSDKENSFPISGTVRITPSPTNGLPTIINKTTGKPNASKYDLLGRPILNDDSKGIYIQDGRKFMNIRR